MTKIIISILGLFKSTIYYSKNIYAIGNSTLGKFGDLNKDNSN